MLLNNLRNVPLENFEDVRQVLIHFSEEIEARQTLNEILINVLHEESRRLEDKIDQNTLAIRSLEQMVIQTNVRLDRLIDTTNEKLDTLAKKSDIQAEKLDTLTGKFDAGFGNIGRLLQEISNKLD